MILVSDDNEFSRSAVCRLLRKLGEQTCEAQCGNLTIAALQTNTKIEIILADYVMPRGGAELLTRIREVRMIPVILMTGMDPQNFLNTTYDAYLWKPFDLEDVRAALEYVRRKYRNRDVDP